MIVGELWGAMGVVMVVRGNEGRKTREIKIFFFDLKGKIKKLFKRKRDPVLNTFDSSIV